MARMPQVRVVQATRAARQRRKPRRPQHTFNVIAKPFEICPFLIAPVLPGESLSNLLMQSKAVSDPVKNKLIGWWKEYFFFYIPLPALADPELAPAIFSLDDLTGFVLDPAVDLSAVPGATIINNSEALYGFKTSMAWVYTCMNYVVNKWFRDEDDRNIDHYIENYPSAYFDRRSWLQSLKSESQTGDDVELPGVDEQEELDILPGFTSQYAQWEIMRDSGKTDLSYADFLRSYGVTPSAEDDVDAPGGFAFKGELIGYERSWQNPVNHIDPTDGSPTSALVWKTAERLDKTRFFKHPGFIFGVTVSRPKIYLGSQKGAAVGLLKNAYAWLPSVLSGHPYTSVTEQLDSATEGILQNQVEDYWWDVKDLFLHGDQFVNHAMSAANNHGLALPAADPEDRWATEALVDSLFVTAGQEYVREDGVVHLEILSNIGGDTTP